MAILPLRDGCRLDVVFEPKEVSLDVRAERVRLTVDGGPERRLTLTGACVGTSAQPEAVSFACAVRASDTKTIALHNASSSAWSLRPVLSNEFFSGPELVEVPAGGKVMYAVTYRPLTMSVAGQPHEGSAFFPIPDGTGLLYTLHGKAETPVAEGRVDTTIVAKAAHVETLRVRNWLHRPQRFRVLVEKASGDASTSIVGPDFVDVPALSSKDYKLTVLSHTASVTTAKITFRNDASGEYSFYELRFVASAAPPRGTVSLEAPVRTATSAKVSVRNPTGSDVTLSATCSSKAVSVVGGPSVTVPANSVASVELSYRPLLVGTSDASLKLECAELGVFEWKLRLAGTATVPERGLTFSVPLGSRATQVFRFTHWHADKADYKVTFRSGAKVPAFEAAATVVAPPAPPGGAGCEASLEVHFEPTALGESIRDTLVLTSPTGGEYEVPLVGRCLPPKPQGPIECGKGSGSVPFKNVFDRDAEFLYSVDNPAFAVSKPSEKVPAKKATNIAVAFKPDPAKGATTRTGKLTVACPSMSSSPWVFYLQATEGLK
eukprot:366348-Chlamydomonas_euryale.AAC.12